MNVESFAIGVVTMIVFALAIITVLGILKVTSLAKSLVTLKSRLEDNERELSREIHMFEQTLSNQINHTHDGMNRSMDEMYRHSMAYTDKRVDKLIDTYFDHKNIKKQVLKD